MTNRTRTRTPRRIKDWAHRELQTETLAANATQTNDLLTGWYADRGVTSVPGVTVMRVVGQMYVHSVAVAGVVDVNVGILVLNKDFTGVAPLPYLDTAQWLWTFKFFGKNVLESNSAAGHTGFHMVSFDVKARRRIRHADERLFFITFNSDATDAIKMHLTARILLALP